MDRRARGLVIGTLAVAVAVVVVLGVFTYPWWGSPSGTPSSSPAGPAVHLFLNSSGANGLSGTETVQIYWNVPTSAGYLAASDPSGNVSTNPYDDVLFEASTSSGGVLTGSLSSRFNTLDALELSVMSSITTATSLSVYATDQVTSGTTLNVYAYSNNLPFNPRAPPSEFWLNITFPSTPTFSLSTGSQSPASNPVPSHWTPSPCSSGYSWSWLNSTYMPTGYLPLDIVNDSAGSSGSDIISSLNVAAGVLELSFNSETAYSYSGTVSGLQMGSNPSWSGNDTTFSGSGDSIDAFPSHPLGMIALGNTTAYVSNFEWEHTTDYSGVCRSTPTGRIMTTVEMDGLTTGISAFGFDTYRLPSFFGPVVASAHPYHPYANGTLVAGGGALSLYSVMQNASGYSNAQNALNQIVSALSAIALCVGLMTTVNDVLGLIPGASDVSNTGEGLTVLADIYGDVAGFTAMFSSISYSLTAHYSIESVIFNEPGPSSNLPIQFLEANGPSTLDVGGTTYTTNMPLVYVTAT